MKYALKEWSSTIEALGKGEIVAIWRKGGVSDIPSIKTPFETFKCEQQKFVLFPTYTHQDLSKIKLRYHSFSDQQSLPNKDNQVKLKYWAEILDETEVNSLEELLAVSDELINSEEYLKSSWNLYPDHRGKILFLRVYHLSDNILITNQPEYAGCKSWIELNIDVPKTGSKSILSFKDFTKKVRLVKSILENVRQNKALSLSI